MPSLIDVEQQRAALWAAGFRPVPVYNAEVGTEKSGKAPRGDAWHLKARQDPPAAVVNPAEDVAINTGILCDGLRALDIDVDDRATALRVAGLATHMLGGAPTRYRVGSGRVLLLYRAAEGEPPKRTLAGDAGKIEILGQGQQFVAYGTHWTGAELQWTARPETIGCDNLPAVTEDQITAFLREAAAIIGAAPEDAGGGGITGDRRTSYKGTAAEDVLRVAAAMHDIPNAGPADWERWNRTGMALWAATGGSEFGRDLWHGWSARNSAYDPDATDERWTHFAQSPPKRIGAGTLVHMARDARAGAAFVAAGGDDAPAARRSTGIRLLTPAECAEAPARGYLIKGFLAPGDVGCLFGPPGAGKSVLAPHLAWAVAQGAAAFGRKTRQGGVFYVAAEDEAGMRQRINALRERRGDAPGFRLVIGASNLLDPGEAAELGAFVAAARPVLIVIDTLAMAAPGIDENTSGAMSSVVKMARDLTKHGAAVLLVHHDTKAGTGTPRGHSLLNGALDVSLQLDPADKDGIVRGSLRKNRNGPCYGSIAFRIESATLGLDADLESITAPIAAEVSAGELAEPAAEGDIEAPGPDADLPPLAQTALHLLRMLSDRHDIVDRVDWHAEFTALPQLAASTPASRDRMFRRVLGTLAERGLIRDAGGFYWPADLPSVVAMESLLTK